MAKSYDLIIGGAVWWVLCRRYCWQNFYGIGLWIKTRWDFVCYAPGLLTRESALFQSVKALLETAEMAKAFLDDYRIFMTIMVCLGMALVTVMLILMMMNT